MHIIGPCTFFIGQFSQVLLPSVSLDLFILHPILRMGVNTPQVHLALWNFIRLLCTQFLRSSRALWKTSHLSGYHQHHSTCIIWWYTQCHSFHPALSLSIHTSPFPYKTLIPQTIILELRIVHTTP